MFQRGSAMSYFARKIREEIQERRAQEQEFCRICQEHAGNYMEALELSFEDLQSLFDIEEEKSPLPFDPEETDWDKAPGEFWASQQTCVAEKTGGFLDIEVDGEKFYLTVCFLTVPSAHENESLPFLLAVCKSNEELNKTLYGPSYYFNYVPEGWHKKIVEHLKKEKDDLVS